MRTRGFKAWRFRKRHYTLYNNKDSYPDHLGMQIVQRIPSDREKYLAWLQAERKKVEEWETFWDRKMAVEPGTKASWEDLDFENPPTSFAPLNDVLIEWVYIIDLDRELFSVNNGAHFRLDQISKLNWPEALGEGRRGDTIALPARLPDGVMTGLVAATCAAGATENTGFELEGIGQPSDLAHRTVTPKDIGDFPWRRRHGPIFRSMCFWIWSRRTGSLFNLMQDELAATLLQWTPEDFPFREIAFAVLCLALGGRRATVLPSNILSMEDGVFGNIKSEDHSGTGTAFVSGLATGAHVQELRPGSSPKEVIYWLEGVLVSLTTQLFRAQDVLDEVSRVAKYCEQQCPEDVVDAVLMSIEHVVLIHIIPNREVQHTALMPLFGIENHLSLDARDRYASTYLEKLACIDEKTFENNRQFRLRRGNQRWEALREMRTNKILEMHFEDTDDNQEGEEEDDPALYLSQRGVKGNPISTLYALMHLFDAAARRRMPYNRAREGRLPVEIYSEIFKHISDMATRESCMKASRNFAKCARKISSPRRGQSL